MIYFLAIGTCNYRSDKYWAILIGLPYRFTDLLTMVTSLAWSVLCMVLVISLACIDARKTTKASVDGEEDTDIAINGVPNGNSEAGIAERVVAVKNPATGEIELKEEKMLVNVQTGQADDEEAADEIDDSKNDDPSAAYTKINPCASSPCEEGMECNIDENGQPICSCIKTCPSDSPFKVCSSFNETFDSECHMYQQRCLCQRELAGCSNPKNKDMQLEYLRECRELPLCTPDEMADFPRRMGDWLFQIMKELAKRDELAPQYRKYEKRSEGNYQPGQPLPHPILWKFCDLDRVPNDRHISRKELMPVRAPLIPMEHCIASFLDDCDSDNDHKLTLAEWGKCLKLEEAEIEDICSHTMKQSGGSKRPRSAGDQTAPSELDAEE
ncbi:SPARC protein [Hypsibius exemplaris]|uniref:SPARC protein n=1 Tax=Hypsibius exemplaris TaxID=2072580 RepID=A0A1W0XB99_HYPEX|nr:SPARC protein [Hypsibius exemplaris]